MKIFITTESINQTNNALLDTICTMLKSAIPVYCFKGDMKKKTC